MRLLLNCKITLSLKLWENIEWQFNGIQGHSRLRSVGKTSPVAKSISHFSKSNFPKDSVSSRTGKSKLRQGILTEYLCVGLQLHLSNIKRKSNKRMISCIHDDFFQIIFRYVNNYFRACLISYLVLSGPSLKRITHLTNYIMDESCFFFANQQIKENIFEFWISFRNKQSCHGQRWNWR